MRFTRGRVWELKNGHDSVTIQNRTHVCMNFFHHKDLGNHLLQLCPKVVKHPVYVTLQSSTCFEQHPAHPQEDKLYYYSLCYRHSRPHSMPVENGLQSALNLHTVRLFTEVTIPEAVVIQFVLLRMSRVLLDTC